MDNYQLNKEIIAKHNDGNHVNGDATEPTECKEVEMIKCDTVGCPTEMEVQEHYINGGLCWKCIERIGK